MSKSRILISVLLLHISLSARAEDVRQEVWISDLTLCEPAKAISRDHRPGTWLSANYEVAEGKGVMLFAMPESDAPPLALKLKVKGWYQIRLGMFYGGRDRYLSAKLAGDPAHSRFGREIIYRRDGNYPEKKVERYDISEVLWKSADLTGQDLIIAHPPSGTMAQKESNLSYVRLVPMDEAAVAEWKSEQPTEVSTSACFANGRLSSDWATATT